MLGLPQHIHRSVPDPTVRVRGSHVHRIPGVRQAIRKSSGEASSRGHGEKYFRRPLGAVAPELFGDFARTKRHREHTLEGTGSFPRRLWF